MKNRPAITIDVTCRIDVGRLPSIFSAEQLDAMFRGIGAVVGSSDKLKIMKAQDEWVKQQQQAAVQTAISG